MDQLDLFAITAALKPTAVVHRFPLCRRVDLVRATAAELRSRSYSAGKRYWSAHVQRVRRELRTTGVAAPEIDREIADYALAVRREIHSCIPRRGAR